MAKKKQDAILPDVQPALTNETSAGVGSASASGEIVEVPTLIPTHCAFVDEKGVYQGLVEYPALGTETAQHLLHINQCDLGVGEYVWDAKEQSFHPIKARNNANVLALDALDASIKLFQKNDIDVPLEVLIWVKQLKVQFA